MASTTKKDLISKHARGANDTGSPEVQVAILTDRINHLTGHLKQKPKDKSSERSLVLLVGKRKALLDYLKKSDIERYRAILKKLDIRK